MSKVYVLILGMMLVTYIPRLIPFLVMGNRKIPENVEEFLSYIPYAALGALIIPGFISAIPNHPFISAAGLLTALILGYFKDGVVIPVLGSICMCMILINLGI